MTRPYALTRSKDGVYRVDVNVSFREPLENLACYLVAHHHGMPPDEDLEELSTRTGVIRESKRILKLAGTETAGYIVGDNGLQDDVTELTALLARVWAGHGKADLAERLLAKHRKDPI